MERGRGGGWRDEGAEGPVQDRRGGLRGEERAGGAGQAEWTEGVSECSGDETVTTQTATQVPLILNRTSLFLRLVLRTQDTSRRCARAVASVAAGAVQVPGRGLFPAKQSHVAGPLWAQPARGSGCRIIFPL